jgi:8-oxo-dGTP diphosphatase
VRFAFDRADKTELAAAVHPDNEASARVLEKAGFSYSHTSNTLPGRCSSIEARIFTQSAQDWFAREAAKPKLLVVAVALIDADGRVLMAKRPIGKSMAGLWEFPGGKVHDDETPESALVRELKEELDIDISESCLAAFTFASHAYESFHLLMPLYLCRTWKGALRPVEGQELAWVKPMRLNQLPMPPADIPMVALLMDYL